MPSLSTSNAGTVVSHVSAACSAASTWFRGCRRASVCQTVLLLAPGSHHTPISLCNLACPAGMTFLYIFFVTCGALQNIRQLNGISFVPPSLSTLWCQEL